MSRAKFRLPESARTFDYEDKYLNAFRGLIYHPLYGFFFKHRFLMVDRLLKQNYEKALEVGFGPGLLIPALAKKCGIIYGIDSHDRATKTKELLREEGIPKFHLLRADACDMPFKEKTFDLVICQSVLEHLPEPYRAIEEIARVLKTGATAVICFPVKNRITKLLFSILGCNDNEIHPSGHEEILENTKNYFDLATKSFYPGILKENHSIYFAGEFIKK